jgi:hypothetical protein
MPHTLLLVAAQSKCKALGSDCFKCLHLKPPAVTSVCNWCHTMRSIIAQYGAQLSAFNNQCKKTLAAQRLCPRGTKPGVGGYCTSLKGTCCNANYEGLSRKWVGGLSDKATCARFCSAEPACTGFSFGVWTDKKNYCNIFGPWWLLNPPSVAFSAWTNTPGSNAAIGGVCKGTAFAKYECVARAGGGSGGH